MARSKPEPSLWTIRLAVCNSVGAVCVCVCAPARMHPYVLKEAQHSPEASMLAVKEIREPQEVRHCRDGEARLWGPAMLHAELYVHMDPGPHWMPDFSGKYPQQEVTLPPAWVLLKSS